MSAGTADLRRVRSFSQLVAYLRDELDWPIVKADFEELTFDYSAEELGIDPKIAAKIEEIRRLRPLTATQPWGIFFIKFEPKRLPVVALRRILNSVVLKKRVAGAAVDNAAWALDDLLFISNFGEGDQRQISFAHFSAPVQGSELPALKILGWDNENTKLHIDHVSSELHNKLLWPENEDDAHAWRTTWRSAFSVQHREVVRTSRSLAERLAELARVIRDRINAVLEVETPDGQVTQLMGAFRVALIHDLGPDDFADMYAQTVAYGLLTARIADPDRSTARQLFSQMQISPFLRELLAAILRPTAEKDSLPAAGTVDFDELGVGEVVDLLDHTNIEAVLRDFGDQNPLEDPVIHFYELFLTEYDAKKRMQRGVFYTPMPVVSYIVRSVDTLLRERFGLQDGLADTTTWRDVSARLRIDIPPSVNPDSPFVQILDPATGTGTFLVEVIDLVHDRMINKWRRQGQSARVQELWNEYVGHYLLPRLHGFELLMAPYAIAHLKVGLKLYETGYKFESHERARIYLTDTLESAQEFSDRLEFAVPALGHEARAVNDVKHNTYFTVILGNPPYSNYSANLSKEARSIVDKYRKFAGVQIRERNQLQFERNLQDDFVKFIAIAEDGIARSGAGVLGYITNATMLGSPSLRGMREHLLRTFGELFEYHLHGGVNESRPGDQNVFDISQAVAIHLYALTCVEKHGQISFAELSGARSAKYSVLLAQDIDVTDWTRVAPDIDTRSFLPQDEGGNYSSVTLDEVFVKYGAGIKTNRDAVVVGLTGEDLVASVRAHTDRYSAREIREHTKAILYRPFDTRKIFYHADLVASRSLPTMQHILAGENLVLLASSSWTTPERFSVNVSRQIVEMKAGTHDRGTTAFPLYRYEDVLGTRTKVSNFEPRFLRRWRDAAGNSNIDVDENEARDVLSWIYALCYSPEYRRRHRSVLSQGFPLVLFPNSPAMRDSIIALGIQLIQVHLLDSPLLGDVTARYEGPEQPEVGKVRWADDTIHINAGNSKQQSRSLSTSGAAFHAVPEGVWTFEIGGYPVLYKWLKDRKGRRLSDHEVTHYLLITEAIRQTILLMARVDAAIEGHGGWPDAFARGV